jgi:hypothetical protein
MDGTNEDEDGRDIDEEIDADEDELENIANNVSASLAKSTKTAIKHLDKYLVYLNQIDSNANPYTSYSHEIIPIQYFTKDLIGKFADYLMKIVKIKKLETTTGYISKLKGKLALDYDPHTLPFLASSLFYTKLRLTVTRFYVSKCAHTGENLSDKAPPMTFDDLKIINDILIRWQYWMTKGRGSKVQGDHEEEEDEGGEDVSASQPNKTRNRAITKKFYATIKKLKLVDISHYPSPSNVQDLVTSESEYYVKELFSTYNSSNGNNRIDSNDNNEENNNCNSSSDCTNNNKKSSRPANTSNAQQKNRKKVKVTV